MGIREIAKKIFLHYQVQMWYAGVADGEYGKAGRFISPSLSILTLLRVSGTIVRFWQVCVAYLLIMFLAAVSGLILVKMGIVAFNNTLGNNENMEIKEILRMQEEISKKLG